MVSLSTIQLTNSDDHRITIQMNLSLVHWIPYSLDKIASCLEAKLTNQRGIFPCHSYYGFPLHNIFLFLPLSTSSIFLSLNRVYHPSGLLWRLKIAHVDPTFLCISSTERSVDRLYHLARSAQFHYSNSANPPCVSPKEDQMRIERSSSCSSTQFLLCSPLTQPRRGVRLQRRRMNAFTVRDRNIIGNCIPYAMAITWALKAQ